MFWTPHYLASELLPTPRLSRYNVLLACKSLIILLFTHRHWIYLTLYMVGGRILILCVPYQYSFQFFSYQLSSAHQLPGSPFSYCFAVRNNICSIKCQKPINVEYVSGLYILLVFYMSIIASATGQFDYFSSKIIQCFQKHLPTVQVCLGFCWPFAFS